LKALAKALRSGSGQNYRPGEERKNKERTKEEVRLATASTSAGGHGDWSRREGSDSPSPRLPSPLLRLWHDLPSSDSGMASKTARQG
jgi:hypothetical protein